MEHTLIYTHLLDDHDDAYVVKVAHSVDEACQLLEAGFTYITDYDGMKLFRKRK